MFFFLLQNRITKKKVPSHLRSACDKVSMLLLVYHEKKNYYYLLVILYFDINPHITIAYFSPFKKYD